MDNWFIKIHRKILNWEWYDDVNTLSLFIHCLVLANWENKQWHWIEIERWGFITSLLHLSKEVWLTVQQTRTSLDKLKKTKNITIKSTNKYTLVMVLNYDKYQCNENKSTNKITNEQQTNNKQITTTKEYKNIRIYNNIEFKEFIENEENKQTTSYWLLLSLINLWYKPSKNETIDSFRNWVKWIVELHKIDSLDKFKNICKEFELYWKTNNKVIKNYKSTFLNCPHLPLNQKKYAK